MTIKEFYESIGSNYEETLGRLCSEKLIARLLGAFDKDPSMTQLEEAINARDAVAAFKAAHTLKGVSLNMGFTRLGQSSSELTEMLRDAADFNIDGVEAAFATVKNDYQEVMDKKSQIV